MKSSITALFSFLTLLLQVSLTRIPCRFQDFYVICTVQGSRPCLGAEGCEINVAKHFESFPNDEPDHSDQSNVVDDTESYNVIESIVPKLKVFFSNDASLSTKFDILKKVLKNKEIKIGLDSLMNEDTVDFALANLPKLMMLIDDYLENNNNENISTKKTIQDLFLSISQSETALRSVGELMSLIKASTLEEVFPKLLNSFQDNLMKTSTNTINREGGIIDHKDWFNMQREAENQEQEFLDLVDVNLKRANAIRMELLKVSIDKFEHVLLESTRLLSSNELQDSISRMFSSSEFGFLSFLEPIGIKRMLSSDNIGFLLQKYLEPAKQRLVHEMFHLKEDLGSAFHDVDDTMMKDIEEFLKAKRQEL